MIELSPPENPGRFERGRLDARYAGDGLHLNEAGYRLWAKFLRKSGAL